MSATYVPPGYPKASNGQSLGASGSDGLPGLPGQNGGNFFGFGNQFSNLGECLIFCFDFYFKRVILSFFLNRKAYI